MNGFSGVIVPTVTPFKEDLSLDLDALRWLISFLSESKVDGIFVNSTTGEFVHLTEDEMMEITEVSLDATEGPKIISGISANRTEKVISLGKKMKDLGVDGAVLMPPFFFRLKEDWLLHHFTRIANSVDIPLIIYNIPSLTGNDIPISVYVKLAEEFSNVVGAKVTKDSVTYIRNLIRRVKEVRPDFSVLTGMDDHLLNTLALGGDGGIMALANVAPQIHVSILRSWRSGDIKEAVASFRKLASLARIYDFTTSFPTAIKTALSILGAPVKELCRHPLMVESAEARSKVREVLEEMELTLSP